MQINKFLNGLVGGRGGALQGLWNCGPISIKSWQECKHQCFWNCCAKAST